MRKLVIPLGSTLSEKQYRQFLKHAYSIMWERGCISSSEDEDALELVHLIPSVPETILALHIGINDSVCTKSIVSPFLPRHAHHTIFAFDPNRYSGGNSVPAGTQDIKTALRGFEPPAAEWSPGWTYVYITDPSRTPRSLWSEGGYIDLIPGKHEDFQLATNPARHPICFFVDKRALEHPVNRQRAYLKDAIRRAERQRTRFEIPRGLEKSIEGLVPVVLEQGERLYIASTDHMPCAHAWSAVPAARDDSLALVYESSAVPAELLYNRPARQKKYAPKLSPPRGSSDMTTDVFFDKVNRKPLLQGAISG